MIKLKVPITMLWSDMPGYTETSMTVSGLLVSIRSNIFPDIGLVVILQCWLTPISLIVSRIFLQRWNDHIGNAIEEDKDRIEM